MRDKHAKGLRIVLAGLLVFLGSGFLNAEVLAQDSGLSTYIHTAEDSYAVGELITFDITMVNKAPYPVRDVTVFNRMPMGFERVDSPGQWDFGELPAGASRTLEDALHIRLVRMLPEFAGESIVTPDPLPRAGEEAAGLLLPFLLIGTGSGLAVYVLYRNRKAVKPTVSLLLVSAFVLSAGGGAVETSAAPVREEYSVSHTLMIGDKAFQFDFHTRYTVEVSSEETDSTVTSPVQTPPSVTVTSTTIVDSSSPVPVENGNVAGTAPSSEREETGAASTDSTESSASLTATEVQTSTVPPTAVSTAEAVPSSVTTPVSDSEAGAGSGDSAATTSTAAETVTTSAETGTETTRDSTAATTASALETTAASTASTESTASMTSSAAATTAETTAAATVSETTADTGTIEPPSSATSADTTASVPETSSTAASTAGTEPTAAATSTAETGTSTTAASATTTAATSTTAIVTATTTATTTTTATVPTEPAPVPPSYGREITNIPLAGGDVPLPQNGPPAAGSVITPVYDPYWRYDPDPFRLAIMSRVEEALDQGLTELDLTDLLQDRQIPADETAAFQRLIGSLIFTVKEGNPAYFYYDNTVVSNTRYTETDEVRTFVEYRISFSYREAYASQTAREAEWANLTREANRVAGIIMTRTSNDWQRLRLVHDYLAVKNVYSPDSNPLTNNVVNGLLGTETMCVGYAQAFQMIASRMGYETYNIYGFAFDQAHLWNIVNLNGQWYHVDVTFDDPAGNTFEIPLVKTQFFLRSAASMAETHETYSYAVPAADSDYLAEHHDIIRNYEDSETLTEALAEYIAALNFSSGRAHVFEYYTQTLNLSAQSLDMMIREAFERALTTVSVSYSYIVREDTGAIFFFPPQP